LKLITFVIISLVACFNTYGGFGNFTPCPLGDMSGLKIISGTQIKLSSCNTFACSGRRVKMMERVDLGNRLPVQKKPIEYYDIEAMKRKIAMIKLRVKHQREAEERLKR
jgi:hypothetical protein